MAENIKKIKVSGTDHDIEALHFITGSLDTPAQWKSYIDSLINKGTSIKGPYNALPDISTDQKKKDAYTEYAGDIILITDSTAESGTYAEYVGITGKIGTTTEDNAILSWEKIGTTKADLSEYGLAGTYTTSGPNPNVTGTGGEQTATVSGSITYAKASTAETAGAHTHGVTFTTGSFVTGVATGGTAAVLTGVKAGSTITAVTGITTSSGSVGLTGGGFTPTTKYAKVTSSAAGTTTVLTGVKSTGSATFVTGVTYGTGTVGYTAAALGTASTTTAVTGVSTTADTAIKTLGTGSFFNNATVNSGVLSFLSGNAYNSVSASFSAIKTVSTTTATVVTGYPNFSGGSLTGTKTFLTSASASGYGTAVTGVDSNGTATVATEGVKNVTLNIATTSSTGAQAFIESATHANPSLSGTTTFLTSATASGTDTAIKTVTGNGTETVIKSTGLATDTAVKGGIATLSAGGHTHSVSSANTTATFSLSAAVSGHTHSLSNHTHTVTVPNNGE